MHAAEGREYSHREVLDSIPGYDLELQHSFSFYLLRQCGSLKEFQGLGCDDMKIRLLTINLSVLCLVVLNTETSPDAFQSTEES